MSKKQIKTKKTETNKASSKQSTFAFKLAQQLRHFSNLKVSGAKKATKQFVQNKHKKKNWLICDFRNPKYVQTIDRQKVLPK